MLMWRIFKMKFTTIRDLYNWAVENSIDLLDMPIALQYQDGGGTYNGNTYEHGLEQVEYGDSDYDATLFISVENDKRSDTPYILLG